MGGQWADGMRRGQRCDIRRDYGRVSEYVPSSKLVRTKCNVRTLRLEDLVLPSCRDVWSCNRSCRDVHALEKELDEAQLKIELESLGKS